MPKIVSINCYRVIQDLHTMNSGEKTCMASRVFYTSKVLPDGPVQELFTDIGQPYGTDYDKPFECGAPFIHENSSFPCKLQIARLRLSNALVAGI